MNRALERPEDELLDTLPCALLRFDASGRVRACNARLLDLLGRNRRQVTGSRLDTLLTPGSTMFLRTYVLPLLMGRGQADEIALDLQHVDGSELPVLVSARREGLGADAVVHCAILPAPRRTDQERDLQRARREVERARGHLERANAELDRFAASAAHDLSEPTRKVRAFGDRLLHSQRSQLHPGDRDYVARMLAAAERMQGMIDGLHQLARSGQASEGRPRRQLAEVVSQVLGDFDRHITAAAAEVIVGELPDVDVDAVAVGQVLQNLLANAITYRRDGVVPEVQIEAGWLEPADAPTWWLRVRDNGTGFAPEHAVRLFEPFFRLHDKHKYPGAGLGLATSQRLARGLGGDLRAEGRPNEGASLTLTLPA
ncbi:sensor histidine kinase [Arenimonas aestuarii]